MGGPNRGPITIVHMRTLGLQPLCMALRLPLGLRPPLVVPLGSPLGSPLGLPLDLLLGLHPLGLPLSSELAEMLRSMTVVRAKLCVLRAMKNVSPTAASSNKEALNTKRADYNANLTLGSVSTKLVSELADALKSCALDLHLPRRLAKVAS